MKSYDNIDLRVKILVGLIFFGLFTNACEKKSEQKLYFVTDSAYILTAEQESNLTALLRNLEKSIGSQVAILTIKSLNGEKMEDFSLRTANDWKLGRKDYDDGVLITVALQDRQMRIEVGLGLEKVIKNEIAAQIIGEDMAPNFKEERYYEGLLLAVEKITKLINDNQDLIRQR